MVVVCKDLNPQLLDSTVTLPTRSKPLSEPAASTEATYCLKNDQARLVSCMAGPLNQLSLLLRELPCLDFFKRKSVFKLISSLGPKCRGYIRLKCIIMQRIIIKKHTRKYLRKLRSGKKVPDSAGQVI